MASQIIAVVGATGAQGGGLVQALLKNGKFKVRALTRNTTSDKAKKLLEMGVEVVEADLDDVASLTKAFEGAYGAFFLTNFWEHLSAEKEKAQLKNLADAAAAVGIEHVVNSTLEDTRPFFKKQENPPPLLSGDMFVPHFDGKADMIDYIGEKVPTTHLFTAFYFENFIYFGMGPKPGEDGTLAINFNMENKVLPMVSVGDIGRVAAKIFEDSSLVGKKVYLSSKEETTGEAIAKAFTKVIEKPVVYSAVPFEQYRNFDFPGAHEMANMFKFKADNPEFISLRMNDPIVAKLVPDLVNLETFLTENKAKFM